MHRTYGNTSDFANYLRIHIGKIEESTGKKLAYRWGSNLPAPNNCLTCHRKPQNAHQQMCKAVCGKCK